MILRAVSQAVDFHLPQVEALVSHKTESELQCLEENPKRDLTGRVPLKKTYQTCHTQNTQGLGIRKDIGLVLPEVLMSLAKEIDLVSAAHLSYFQGSLSDCFASLFLGTGNPDCPQRLKCSV